LGDKSSASATVGPDERVKIDSRNRDIMMLAGGSALNGGRINRRPVKSSLRHNPQNLFAVEDSSRIFGNTNNNWFAMSMVGGGPYNGWADFETKPANNFGNSYFGMGR
jgi:hypothetical protein